MEVPLAGLRACLLRLTVIGSPLADDEVGAAAGASWPKVVPASMQISRTNLMLMGPTPHKSE